jgi:hypothetical protein
MKKRIRKIGIIAATATLALGMNITAFADDQIGADGTVTTTSSSIEIQKGITVNGSLAYVYGPSVTYNYTVAPAAVESGAGVTDANGVKSVVTAGPAGGVTLANNGQITFASEEVSTANELTGTITANVDITKFTKPGIYRYEITDITSTEALFNAGITRPDGYDTTRYLDVYIHNNNGALEVYGYVLAADNETAITTNTTKSTGFTADSEGGGAKTDQYTTIDVTLTKNVTGSMGDINHEFPFAITVDNNGLAYYGNKGTAATTDNDMTDTAITTTLKNADTYYIAGLNPKAAVIYEETNDTADEYTLTITKADGTELFNNKIAANEAKNTGEAALKVSNYDTDNNAQTTAAQINADNGNKAITFTNNLEEISPTGVVMRFAPYFLILAAGIVLLVIKGRRTKEA